MELDDVAGARRDFDQALALEPGNPFARVHRALLSLDEANLDAARSDLEILLKDVPDSVEGLNARGLLHLRENKFDNAIADFTKAIEIYPQFSGAFLNRATVHQRRGDYQAALKDYSDAQRYDPNNVEAFNDAAWLLATCPDEKVRNPKLAIQLAEQAATIAGAPEGNFLDTLAAAYAADGQFDDAVATAEHALKILPETDRAPTQARLEKYREKQPHVEPQAATGAR